MVLDEIQVTDSGLWTGFAARLVVDMTGTRFCDSAGIHTLVGASEQAQAEGGELRLVIAPGGTVPRILKLTGVDRIIPCFASLAEALARPQTRIAAPARRSDEVER